MLAATPHGAYCEPFVGMGGVFLRRRVRPAVEVINDVSGDVVTLFWVLQRFPEALLRELKVAAGEPDRVRPAEGKPGRGPAGHRARGPVPVSAEPGLRREGGRANFGTDANQPHNFDLRRLEPRLRRLHDRLAGVVIENLDWLDFIGRYDRPGTLFYLDPPYWGSEGDYGSGLFIRGDFQRMADRLQAAEGMFLLSINDRPEIRELFAWADMEAVKTTYTIAGGEHAKQAGELLIGRGVNLAPAAAQASLL